MNVCPALCWHIKVAYMPEYAKSIIFVRKEIIKVFLAKLDVRTFITTNELLRYLLTFHYVYLKQT